MIHVVDVFRIKQENEDLALASFILNGFLVLLL